MCVLADLRNRRRGDRLDVVAVEVALEVEIRERLTLADRQQLLERRVRLDVVLVLQALLLHVVVHRLRDLRAAHERRRRLAKEEAELVRDLRGALEDAGHARLGVRALLGLNAALALARILDLAVDTLLELLHLREHRGHRLAERVEVARDRLEVLIERRGRAGDNRRRRRLDGGRGNNDRCGDNSRRGGRRLLGDRLLGRLRHRGRGSHNGGRGSNLLLRNLLRSGLGRGGGRGVHYTGGGGSTRRHFYAGLYLHPHDTGPSILEPPRAKFLTGVREILFLFENRRNLVTLRWELRSATRKRLSKGPPIQPPKSRPRIRDGCHAGRYLS